MKITDVQACVIGRPEPHSGGNVWTFVRMYPTNLAWASS